MHSLPLTCLAVPSSIPCRHVHEWLHHLLPPARAPYHTHNHACRPWMVEKWKCNVWVYAWIYHCYCSRSNSFVRLEDYHWQVGAFSCSSTPTRSQCPQRWEHHAYWFNLGNLQLEFINNTGHSPTRGRTLADDQGILHMCRWMPTYMHTPHPYFTPVLPFLPLPLYVLMFFRSHLYACACMYAPHPYFPSSLCLCIDAFRSHLVPCWCTLKNRYTTRKSHM